MDRPFATNGNGTHHITSSGFIFRPSNPEQEAAANAIRDCDVVFLRGGMGTGKTLVAMGMAGEMVRAGKFRRIIVARPLVPAGEKTGFLPGDLDAKLDPWLKGFKDCLVSLTFQNPDQFFTQHVDSEAVAMLRGRTLSRCVTIVDECQNLTVQQIRLVLGRLGRNAKLIMVGDTDQTDLGRPSRFDSFANTLNGMAVVADDGTVHRVATVTLVKQCRHPLITVMMDATANIQD